MTNRAMMRLLKLTTPVLFQNCFIKHSEKGQRIGQGGFGTINKVICDCAVLNVCQQCSWFREKESKKIKQSQLSVAIKRVSRERSAYDNPMFYDIFQEISCLEILSSLPFNGACKLIDYGIVHAEYWIIMECGKYNLKEWRVDHLRKNNSDSFLTTLELRQCLVLFLDTLLIVQEVHNNDITHFDLKCENFIVRSSEFSNELSLSNDKDINVEHFLNAYSHGSCSGCIFVADFGESVYQESPISSDRPFKSRGTLTIQSPEMIALTDSKQNGQKTFTRPNKKSDIWSLGCMLYELLTGEYLFYEKSWPELFVNLCMAEMAPLSFDKLERLISSDNIRAAIESILCSVLKQDAENRITLKDLMVDVHDLIKTINDTPIKEILVKDVDEKVASVDITIPTNEQLNSSLSKSIISTVYISKHVLDCSAQKLFLSLKSKYQMKEAILSEDSQPEKVINKLIKSSSLTHISQILMTEKLSSIYKSLDCLYEIDILIDDGLITVDNQL
jgi:serine/threonine protein kinase